MFDNIVERLMGVITLKAPVYRTIAEDPEATKPAGIIVAVVALIQGFCVGLAASANIGTAILQAGVNLVLSLIAWFVSSWLLAAIAKAFGGKTDTQEMLRVTGHVFIFNLAGILILATLISQSLSCVTSILALVILVLSFIGYFIGVREAAEFSTGKAIGTAILASLASFVITGPLSALINSLF